MAETIFAQATPPGRSGVAIVRISGPDAILAADSLGAVGLPPRKAVLRKLTADGEMLDHALALLFPGPASYTGEDVVELHLHGGPAVVRSVLAAVGALPSLRPADPGEFTRRALTNGKLDLSQVEGLGDLLAAETAAQAQQALALMDGRLSTLVAAWSAELLGALALVEASIDFADEDLPHDILDGVLGRLEALVSAFDLELRNSHASERMRTGFDVALVGAPNVGKSTLLNALARREAAITSEIAGTTRDVIEVRMDLGGLPVTLLDMAGLRTTGDPLEQLGVARARQRASAADLRVFLLEPGQDPEDLRVSRGGDDLVRLAKADLHRAPGVGVSGLTGEGVEGLLGDIRAAVANRAAFPGSLSHERHRLTMVRSRDALSDAIRALGRSSPDVELASLELRLALDALAFLIGKVDVEQVLDVIFAQFCLGK